MRKEIELWQFIRERLGLGRSVMLLVVAQSSGSSPGRPGYKMAVGADGEIIGSIGGGVMEVDLVEQSRKLLYEDLAGQVGSTTSFLKPQVHQKDKQNSSGMICSGRQTIIFKMLNSSDLDTVCTALDSVSHRRNNVLRISAEKFEIQPSGGGIQNAGFAFESTSELEFNYEERLGHHNDLYIIGGGHCALALSELMAKLDFYVRIFDDRADLNTITANRFADEKHVIDSYESVGDLIDSDPHGYLVVMTLGYRSDETVIKQLINKDFKYFGVLGSEAKMRVVIKNLAAAGIDKGRLATIHTPIGLPINSHSPEEIAVSIAAEIISIKNVDKEARKKKLRNAKKIY